MESFWRWWSRLRGVKPEPSQGSLDAALREMRRVRVWHWGAVSEGRLEREILFETDQSEALSALRDTLRIVDGSAGHCMCLGDPLIECLGPANQPLAEISVHHGQRIRWEAWLHDAQLVDGRRLMEWLADRGMRYPLLEYEEGLRWEEAQGTAWNRWLAAMPVCLRRFADEMKESRGWVILTPGTGRSANEYTLEVADGPAIIPPAPAPQRRVSASDRLTAQLHALEEAYPDLCARVLELFAWFGGGAGPWNGFPSYESDGERLLMQFPLHDLLRALDSPGLTEAHLEGAARLFAGWEFRTKRAKEAADLPELLRRRLLEHSMKSTDADKRSRALVAFES